MEHRPGAQGGFRATVKIDSIGCKTIVPLMEVCSAAEVRCPAALVSSPSPKDAGAKPPLGF
jgi:hypothetical protein